MKKQKMKYNMWNTTGFMISNAWRVCKSVIFLCIAMAIVTAGKTTVEMLVVPMVLHQVEIYAPVQDLLQVILIFSGLLFDQFPKASNIALTSTPSFTLSANKLNNALAMESLRKLKYSK